MCIRDSGRNGGNGGYGRIAIHHYGSVTGTSNPSFADIFDRTLVLRKFSGSVI